jgi:hypothetical protein
VFAWGPRRHAKVGKNFCQTRNCVGLERLKGLCKPRFSDHVGFISVYVWSISKHVEASDLAAKNLLKVYSMAD